MLWNAIRDHVHERLPAIIDFALYATFITTTTAVLLGLTWLYVNYGMALFVVATVLLLWLTNLFAERRTSVYFDGDSPLAGGSDKPALPPPGKRALPPPGTRALTPTVRSGTGRKALPPR